MTVILSNSGLDSGDRKGLVLLLCPGVVDALLADRCELNRWGNANRTIADAHRIKKWTRKKSESRKSVGRGGLEPLVNTILVAFWFKTPELIDDPLGASGRSQQVRSQEIRSPPDF